MKILLVNLILHTHEKGVITRRPTNSHTMIYGLARGFKALGHQVTLIASDEYRPTEAEDPGFEIVYFPSRLPAVFKPSVFPWPKGLSRWLRQHADEYDLAISSEVFSMASLAVCRNMAQRTILWQELNIFQRMMKRMPARFWYNVVAPMFMRDALVVGRSESARDFISRFMPRVCDETITNGCDGDIFHPGGTRKDAFVIVSRLVPGKRIDRMISAFADLLRDPRYAGYRLDIIGDGPEADSLRRHAESLGVADAVVFHGFKYPAEWAEIARGAVAMLVDTIMDLNMVTLSEAIANGVPMLMNSVPLNSSFVTDNDCGIVRDGWGCAELAGMIDRYVHFHTNCIKARPQLTAEGCAARFINIAASQLG